jgi:hypothetical protein
MSSSTRWTSRALVAAGVGGLLVLGAAFGAGGVSAASADETPTTTASPEPRTRDERERPGTLPPTAAPAEPLPGAPNYAG